MSAPMSLASGSRLGAYDIICPLGSGGMGEVYRARDSKLGREVALKILPPEVTTEAGRLERFDREARAIAALNHPHIVTIYSTEEADGIRFLTMELVEGRTLNEIIASTAMPVSRFLDIAVPLAEALTAAHQKQITHRDLKPANVMVSHDGRVKILDFGLARVGGSDSAEFSHAATKATLTHQGMLVGTMPYMSPEQVEGRTPDPRSDLFSLGVIFYEMLSGERPFRGTSGPALMSAILRDTPPALGHVRGDMPAALERLVARCLEKRAEDRVQTARDVYNELRHVQKDLDASDRSDATGSQPKASSSIVSGGTRGMWVAVMPFSARSNDDDARALADGLTDDITTGLARFSYLRVLSRAAAEQLAKVPSSTPSPPGRPNARYLVEGSVRKSGSAIRIGVRVADVHTGSNLWAENLDRDAAAGAFALQDELSHRIVSMIGDPTGALGRAISASVGDTPIDQLEPEELTLRYQAYAAQVRPEEHARLRDALERLVERDPQSAVGWAILSRLYEHEHTHRFNSRPDSLRRQRAAAERAVELDSRLQHAWVALAGAHHCARDTQSLRGAVDVAVGLNPLNTEHVAVCALFLSCAGDDERALDLIRDPMKYRPQHSGWYHFIPFNAHYRRGEYEPALEQAKLVSMPTLPLTHMCQAAAAGQLARVAEAARALDALRAINPALLDPAAAHRAWTLWLADQDYVDRLVAGFEQARALLPPYLAGRPTDRR